MIWLILPVRWFTILCCPQNLELSAEILKIIFDDRSLCNSGIYVIRNSNNWVLLLQKKNVFHSHLPVYWVMFLNAYIYKSKKCELIGFIRDIWSNWKKKVLSHYQSKLVSVKELKNVNMFFKWVISTELLLYTNILLNTF